MFGSRAHACLGIFACFCFLAPVAQLRAQTQPSAYTIVETIAFPPAGSTMTIYRNAAKVLTDIYRPADGATPASHTLTLYDIAAGQSWSWNPNDANVPCSVNHFSGDWGDPFAMTNDLAKGIKDGSYKPVGAETISGVPAKIYLGVSDGTTVKAWLDQKDGLVLRAMMGSSSASLQPIINITKAVFSAPNPSVFTLSPKCAGLKPPPTPAEIIAAETGDNPSNYVSAYYGPGSKTSCTILVRVVAAKTMAPLTRRWQAAIDTTYNQDDPHPPAYSFGVGNDGTSTFSGGGLHEVTSQIHNDTLRIDNPPPYFNLAVNVVQPGRGTTTGLIYRQCFAPVTMLYYILKDPTDVGKGTDFLYAKSGKFAAAPAH